MVKGKVWNQDTQEIMTIYRRTPFNSLYFLMVSKFLLGLCPKKLEHQVIKSLLASRKRRNTEGHVMLYQMSHYQIGTLVDNRYYLKRAWVDIWGNSVGGKYTLCLNLFIA
jgi:hypothetical protein